MTALRVAEPIRISRREFLQQTATVAWTAGLGLLAAALPRHVFVATAQAAPSTGVGQTGRGRWIAKAPLPFARTEVSVAGLNGKVYVLAGYAFDRVDQPFN